MTNQLRVSADQVDFYIESLPIQNLVELENLNHVGTKYRIENGVSITFEDTHFDEVSNTVYFLGTYYFLYYLMNYKFYSTKKPLISDCYFEDKDKGKKKFSTVFGKCNVAPNRMIFHNDELKNLNLGLNGVLELDYYLCKQFSGRKSSHLSRLNTLQGRFVDALKAIIGVFKDDLEFSFGDSPRYFLNHFMKSKKITSVADMTNKQLKEAMHFLKKILKITLRYLVPEERVDVSKDIERNRFACIYRSLSIKLYLDKNNEETQGSNEKKNDKLRFTFKIYDANKEEIICKNLLFFSIKNTLIIPYDELVNNHIHFVNIFYGEYCITISVLKFLDNAKKTPEFLP